MNIQTETAAPTMAATTGNGGLVDDKAVAAENYLKLRKQQHPSHSFD